MTFHFPALSPTGSTEDVEHTGVRLELITGDVSNTSGNTNMTWKWVHSIQVRQLQGLRCSVSWLTETLPRHKSIVCGISYSCFFCYDEPKSLRRERRIVLRPPRDSDRADEESHLRFLWSKRSLDFGQPGIGNLQLRGSICRSKGRTAMNVKMCTSQNSSQVNVNK